MIVCTPRAVLVAAAIVATAAANVYAATGSQLVADSAQSIHAGTALFTSGPQASWQRQRPGAPEPTASPEWPVWSAPAMRRVPLSNRNRFEQEVRSAAHKAGVDPALVHAVIRVESAYQIHAVSPKGAVGLMQVIPATGRRFGVEDLLQPSANIHAGTQYLSYLMRMFDGDLPLVLAAYNAGENAVLRHGRRVPPYPETLRYVPRVLDTYQALSKQVTRSP
jgi:soluble lytic murein transglycosylase-like protein